MNSALLRLVGISQFGGGVDVFRWVWLADHEYMQKCFCVCHIAAEPTLSCTSEQGHTDWCLECLHCVGTVRVVTFAKRGEAETLSLTSA